MKRKILVGIVALLFIGIFPVLYVVNVSPTSADSHTNIEATKVSDPAGNEDTAADNHETDAEVASNDHAHAEADADHAGNDQTPPQDEIIIDDTIIFETEADHFADGHTHPEDESASDDANEQAVHVDDGHSHEGGEEIAGGHGHGEPKVGYIGIEEKQAVSEPEVDAFVERVQEEAYAKGKLDQLRFILFGVFFILVYVSFAKIKRWDLSTRLRNAIDWYTMGTITGIILIFLVIPSGIIITFFYMPTSTQAYSSVEAMTRQPILAFFRNLHNWSSEIFMFLSLLHAARAVSTRTFLGKRKLIWVLGALAIVAGWVGFLSGTFMRADQEALEGFEHMMYSFTLVPLGNFISEFFSGEYTMMKLTALHIGVTVFILGVTLALHVLMRKVHVLVTGRWKKALVYSVVLTLFMVVQSVAMEAPFIRGLGNGPTISGIEATKPPWPIYFLIQGENWFGANAMVIILAVAFIPLIIFSYVVEFLPIAKAKKAQVGEILFYAGVFLMLAVSYIAAAGQIQVHLFS
jgi:quinol-cytochrome oxidoreductase complex cytochrome b subunit